MIAPRRLRAFTLLGGLLLLLALLTNSALHNVDLARATVSATKTCTGPTNAPTAVVGDTVNCTLRLISNAPFTDFPHNTILALTPSSTNYTGLTISSPTLTCPTALCIPDPAEIYGSTIRVTCNPAATCGFSVIEIFEQLVITAASPQNITQIVNYFPGGTLTPIPVTVTATFSIQTAGGPPGRTFYTVPEENVPAPTGVAPCTFALPCTITRAIDLARDADTVVLLPGTTGQYLIKSTIRVAELLNIQANSGDKVILKASPGVTIFEVSAQGGPNLHVTIRDFTMGGNYQSGSTAPAILLTNDYFTEIANNIIGAQDLPINNGIVLSNSDHANIHDNTIQGSNRLSYTPILEIGRNTSGFGVVTLECFGGTPAGVSDSVTIYRNLFTNQLIAGVWLCSDGAGKHDIRENTFRGNWRGIALKDVTNATVASNILTDDRSDGIILYGASLRNTVNGNRVESHIAAAAAGIRVGWIADPVMPLSNSITGNTLIRDTIGIHVFGARTTVIQSNELKISGNRTAVLVTPSTTPLDPGSQPFDTEITNNVIVFIGPCGSVLGCGIRLVGTTVPVIATDNDWGLRRASDVEGVIWHQRDDPVLGQVSFQPFKGQIATTAIPSPTPNPAATPPPGVSPTPANGNGGTPGAPVTTLTLEEGCGSLSWPGAPGMSVVDAIMTIQPASAQRTAVIWRRDSDGWRGWGPGLPPGAPRNVFTLDRGDRLTVCIDEPATWTVPLQLGGP